MKSSLSDFTQELRRRVAGDVRVDEYSKLLYSTDASMYQKIPLGVLIPKSADDVQYALELAHQYKIPLLPRTSGSSLAGQCVNTAFVIDFSRHLDQVLEINTAEKWARVQPGLVLDSLNAQLRPHQLMFGPDPASSGRAGMGGVVSNNASGAHSIVYGMTVDHVLGMKVILSDGSSAELKPHSTYQLLQYQVRRDFEANIYQQIAGLVHRPIHQQTIRAGTPNHWRRCGGYNLDRMLDSVNFQSIHVPNFNLAKLICGAEGTLAVMTEITINLVPRPSRTALALLHFDSTPRALNAVETLLELHPSAIELLDELSLRMCQTLPQYNRLLRTFMEGDPACLLVVEFFGDSDKELAHHLERLQTHVKAQGVGVTAITTAIDAERQSNVWEVRKAGLGLLMGVKGDRKPIPFIEDAAVPVAQLPAYIGRLEAFCADLGVEISYYAHASAGCLHVRPLLSTKVISDLTKMEQIARFSAELVGGYGGAISSEHGDGRSRSWLNESFYGKPLYDLFRQIKNIFDPNHLLNPNNIVDGEPLTANLRYGEHYHPSSFAEKLDFSNQGGFVLAVEQCNGAGVCRQLDKGVMCPSFMATREEEHSTRGRANLLRAALSGQLPATELTSPRMYEALDLCVGCKACKVECPSAVDMAKIKIAFLANYQEVHGVSWRSRFFGNIGRITPIIGRFPRLANWANKNKVVRWGLEKYLGITRVRSLPHYAEQSFNSWFKNRKREQTKSKPIVILHNDFYNNYHSPNILISATEFLEGIGFQVKLTNLADVGRPALSKALLKTARHLAKKTLKRLAPHARHNLPVIFCEPSDLSAICDDYAALWPDDPRVALVSSHCYTFEQFIEQLLNEKKLELPPTLANHKVILHGHCHEKALFGTKASHRVLQAVGCKVQEVEGSCCGMAGSFGYEQEHLEISLKMGERRLFPAIRAQEQTVWAVASGVSCRQQITHGTGRRAFHSAELLHHAFINR